MYVLLKIALQMLDASYNQLEILPPLGELRKVETVMLQANKLTTFPDMSGCTLLKVLHLADNNITVCTIIILVYSDYGSLVMSHNF